MQLKAPYYHALANIFLMLYEICGIRKSFTSKKNQPIMRKARDPTKIQVEIKSSFGKSPIISKTSINTQQESKEIFRMKILEKADEMYEKIRTKVA